MMPKMLAKTGLEPSERIIRAWPLFCLYGAHHEKTRRSGFNNSSLAPFIWPLLYLFFDSSLTLFRKRARIIRAWPLLS